MARVEWEEALAIHSRATVVDGCSFFCHGYNDRLKKAGVTALQMTVPWPQDGPRQAIRRYEEYFALFRQDDRLGQVLTVADIRRFKREGRVGLILGSQNGRFLEDDLGMVEVYHRLGVRVIQLTYNTRNFIGDGCHEPIDGGLSKFGHQVVAEMNRLGILVDLTHVGERTSLEAIEASEKPCIFSHSNPKKRAQNVRNITDEQMRRCAEKGGVIGLSPLASITWTGSKEPPTIEDLVDHIEYVVELVGIDHVAIGTDSEATPGAYPPEVDAYLASNFPATRAGFLKAFPDYPKTRGFESMESLPHLTHLLLNRGWREADVYKLLGENLLRVYEAVWA